MMRASALLRQNFQPPRLASSQKRSFYGEWWRENVIKPIHEARFPLPDVLGVPATTYMRRAASLNVAASRRVGGGRRCLDARRRG